MTWEILTQIPILTSRGTPEWCSHNTEGNNGMFKTTGDMKQYPKWQYPWFNQHREIGRYRSTNGLKYFSALCRGKPGDLCRFGNPQAFSVIIPRISCLLLIKSKGYRYHRYALNTYPGAVPSVSKHSTWNTCEQVHHVPRPHTGI